jgi:hypothetical protein
VNKAKVSGTCKGLPSPWSVSVTLPAPENLAFYAGVGAMALLGTIKWPVVAASVVGHALANARHNKVLSITWRGIGRGLAAIHYE